MKKLFLCLSLCSMIVSMMAGCQKSQTVVTNEILTQKKREDGRMQITMLVKYAFSANAFELAVETKFPDIDIVQVGDFTANTTLNNEFKARLEHDDLTDIVMTWPYDVGEEYWEDRLIDLSGMPFSSNYNTSMLDTIVRDDKLYFLPGPATIRGIIYNKTLFEEHGWEIPKDYDSFIELCKTIEETGMSSLQLSLGNSEVLDTAFIGFNYSSCYSKPEDIQWLDAYNTQQEGNFIDHFGVAFETFEEMIDAGILKATDLDLHYQDTQRNLFTRQSAMLEDSTVLIDQGKELYGSSDEFAMMPFYNKDSDWARIYMTCFIGLNKHLQDANQTEKYDKVMEIMNFISSEKGQKALAGDAAMYYSLKGMEAPDVPEIQALLPALNQGRYAIFPTLTHATKALRNGLAEMILNHASREDVATSIDKANQEDHASNSIDVIGTASDDFTLTETGSFVSDVIRSHCKTDIGLFLDNGKDGLYNGKGISAKFYKGDLTDVDIQRVFPDLKHGERGELWKVSMLGKDLIHTLEYAIDVDSLNGWFYYFSGLKMTYDPTANAGERIKKITLENGDQIDEDKLYSIAVMEDSVPEEFIQTCEKTGVLIQDVLKNHIRNTESISPIQDQRFIIP